MKLTELWGELYIPIPSEETERKWGPLYESLASYLNKNAN